MGDSQLQALARAARFVGNNPVLAQHHGLDVAVRLATGRRMPRQKPGLSQQNYATPRRFLDAVKRGMKIPEFTVDFAADRDNRATLVYLDETIDALLLNREQWRQLAGDGYGWLNPPYKNIGKWAKKCAELREDGGRVFLLVPASVGSNWYRQWVEPFARVLALHPRLSFLDDGKGDPYPKDLILCVYDPEFRPGFYHWDWERALDD